MGIEQIEPKLTKAEVQWLRDKIGNMAQVIQSNAEYVKNDQGVDPEGAMSDILVAVKKIEDVLDNMWDSAK